MFERINRRRVIAGATAVAGVAATGVRLNANDGAARPVSLLVTDTRFAASKRFAARIAGTARCQLDISDDVCRHWYGSIRERVRAEQGDLVGVTTWIDFEIMRGCAAEAGYVCHSQQRLPARAGRVSLVSWVFTPRV
jgi:hypothetical protein